MNDEERLLIENTEKEIVYNIGAGTAEPGGLGGRGPPLFRRNLLIIE